MLQAFTLSGLGSSLLGDLQPFVDAALNALPDAEIARRPGVAASIETLCDRLSLSLALGKPIGLVSWAEGSQRELGRRATDALMSAASEALVRRGETVLVGRSVLQAFVEAAGLEMDGALQTLDRTPLPDPADTAAAALLAGATPERSAHAEASASWARRIARSIGWSIERSAFLERCARLHDLGEDALPKGLLEKQGPLDARERSLLRKHTLARQPIGEREPLLRRGGPVVRAHHERFDGTGYPDGLAGQAIPAEARLLAVVDAFHAMISGRPYRAAVPARRALRTLEAGRGTQWDAEYVDALVALVERCPSRSEPAGEHVSSA